MIPKKANGVDYEIDDLYPDQQYIAYLVMKKIKEFMETDDLANFEPLRCTIVGQGGTGKTVLLNTLTSVIRRVFLNANVVKVAAPTGVSACNVGGETLHRMTSRGIGKPYKPGSLTTKEREKLLARFCDFLMAIMDERSMISSTLLGTSAQIVGETIFDGGMQHVTESFGALPVVVIAGDDYQLASFHQGALEALVRRDGGKMTEKGRQVFRECAQTVFQLFQSRRISDGKDTDREIMSAIREGEDISEEHLQKLLSLHLDAIKSKHGPEVVRDIESKAVYLFWTNDKRIQHNIDKLIEMNGPDNPTSVTKPKTTGSKYAIGVNSHFTGDLPGFCLLCDGCMVAICGCNFCPIWGLHNGGCGRIEERVFAKGTNPNNNDHPLYVVVNFPLYSGPVWDINNPTVSQFICNIFIMTCHTSSYLIFRVKSIPIPVYTVRCQYSCCTRTYLPLDLAFARTIHRFQGLSAGPVDKGKIPNMYECIICDPDVKSSESRATGLFYTALSRATTLGDENGLNSAIYFTGTDFTRDRIKNLSMKSNKNEEFINIHRRRQWVKHLKQNTVTPIDISEITDAKEVFQWSKSRITQQQLRNRTRLYVKAKNNKTTLR